MLGRRLGVYEITAVIGAGGMGEVYRAHDTRLDRDVAIKMLPQQFSRDPDRVSRFEREARVLASLNHPNIAVIYGIEGDAIVMELVDGRGLDERLASGFGSARNGKDIDEALSIARQIVDALDGAHDKGVVHRDLKPANICIARDGTVKVLDFGLAKIVTPESTGGAPTIAKTQEGWVVGTPAYMSPEQARGLSVDKRADVWAFGCILYELLTGRQAFKGATVSDTIAATLEREPDWALLPPTVPPRVVELLRHCLAKDSKQRLRDIGDARPAFEQPRFEAERVSRPKFAAVFPWVVSLVSLLAASGVYWQRHSTTVVRPPLIESRTAFDLPAGTNLVSSSPLALSPDGTLAAFVAADGNEERSLYVRPLASPAAVKLPGTAGAAHPFFSPDGRSIGFFAGNALLRASIDGGSPLRVSSLPGADHGGTWGLDETIVVAIRGQGLHKVSANGGALEPLGSAIVGAWPSVLPDGRILFTSFSGGRTTKFAIVGVDGSGLREIARLSDVPGEGAAVLGASAEVQQSVLLPQGYLVFGQDPGYVRAIAMNPQTFVATGSAVTLAEPVERGANSGGVAFAATASGVVLFAETGNEHQLVWVTREGGVSPLDVEKAAYRQPALSPDGEVVAVSANDETRRSHVWLIDIARGNRRRVANGAMMPAWAPDGHRFAQSGGGAALTMIATEGGAPETLGVAEELRERLPAGTSAYPTGWSPDGRFLLFDADAADVWRLSYPEKQIEPVLTGETNEWGAQVSSDGRAIAYVSDASGREEVYVAKWPGLEQKKAVSNRGGRFPRWSADAKELFFWQGRTLMAARIDEELRVAVPTPLFSGDFFGAGRNQAFDVAADGRFMMIKSDARAELRQVSVLQNWIPSVP